MSREAFSDQGLPTPEVRQQILQRAGMILDEARNLMARLDDRESHFLRTGSEQLPLVERTKEEHRLGLQSTSISRNLVAAAASNSHSHHTTLAA